MLSLNFDKLLERFWKYSIPNGRQPLPRLLNLHIYVQTDTGHCSYTSARFLWVEMLMTHVFMKQEGGKRELTSHK
jgi:hypothetical protein